MQDVIAQNIHIYIYIYTTSSMEFGYGTLKDRRSEKRCLSGRASGWNRDVLGICFFFPRETL